jgi:phosphodiesterase/alkaline phosphatase D-like protein
MDKVLGPIVGHVTSTTARLWIRARPAGRAVAARLTSANGDVSITAAVEVSPGIHVADVERLTPATRYRVEMIEADGTPIALAHARLRTFPARLDSLRFAFASCHDFAKPGAAERWQRLGERLDEGDLSLLLLVGDQVYSDDLWDAPYVDQAQREQAYDNRYVESWQDTSVQRAMSLGPTYMMWDDHEIHDDWGSDPLRETPEGLAMFQAAEELYQRHQNAHNPNGYRGARHYGFSLGAVGFYVLDERGARRATPPHDILGDAQWQDLEAWLAGPGDALEVLFLVSPVPLAHISASGMALAQHMGIAAELALDTLDHWNHPTHVAELGRLLDRLFAWQNAVTPRQVVVLSGDVHVATVGTIFADKLKPEKQNRIYQLTSSAIANEITSTIRGIVPQLNHSFVNGKIDLVKGRYHALNQVASARRNFGEVALDRQPDGSWRLRTDLAQADPARPRLTVLEVTL